ncbi:pentatricopeptide repeat-containing protein At2g13600-like [Malania oleifera]|uniref:pentatricopeptide repeat-containing protein At2g13600-like n=1 Tax=Malania oleifera TaxID=397392 RepID=UPI0025ADB897|nr:pentatricopeptide repeat-containing protein At2g13600-like [Malania oleifera]
MFKPLILHASFIKNGFQNHVYHCNILLQAYIKAQALSDARKLLYLMPHPNVVSFNTLLTGYFKSRLVSEALKLFASVPETDTQSWNIVISGCAQNLRVREALTHFVKLFRSRVRPDKFTYSIVILCCDLGLGRQVHAQIVKFCSGLDAFLGTNLLRMYAGYGVPEDARKVFDGMPHRDLVTWNALISCYSEHGMGDMCVGLFCRLVREGIMADEFTYSIVLKEFASRLQVFEAMQVHALIIRGGYCFDRFTNNALINLYCKCGFIASAVMLLEEMPDRDVVSWTTIISGLLQRGYIKDALWLFHEMQFANVQPNSFTFGSFFSACAVTNLLQMGKQFHGLVLKFGLETSVVVGSAVVDMYSKCGELNEALKEFQSMPERDIVSWNGIICGFAQNGDCEEALKLYAEMVRLGPSIIAPNDVTFVGILGACVHNGLVQEGCDYFKEMIHKHLIKPKTEHYTCMVDLLGRAGLVEEAEALVLSLSFKPDFVMWGALLGACKLHRNLEMARRTVKRLCADEPWNSSNYVLLSNSYTFIGEWSKAVEVREAMDSRGVQKTLGCSWVEIGSCMHSFLASHKLHPQIKEVDEVLQRHYIQMEDKV